MASTVPGTFILLLCIIVVSGVAGIIVHKIFYSTENRVLQRSVAEINQVVGSTFRILDVSARGTGNKDLDFFYIKIKLKEGSKDAVNLEKTLISFNPGTAKNDYSYSAHIDCSLIPYNDYSIISLMNETNSNYFGIQYNIRVEGDNNSIGFLTPGDVVTLCFKSPIIVGDGQTILFWITTSGMAKIKLETQTPEVIAGEYISIYNNLI